MTTDPERKHPEAPDWPALTRWVEGEVVRILYEARTGRDALTGEPSALPDGTDGAALVKWAADERAALRLAADASGISPDGAAPLAQWWEKRAVELLGFALGDGRDRCRRVRHARCA